MSELGTGLQMPVNWQQTATPMSRIGEYIPPAATAFSLLGSVGTPGVSTRLTLGSTGVGLQPPSTGFWAPSVNLSNAALSGQSLLIPDVWEQRIAQIGGKGGNAGSGTDIGRNTETFGLGVKGLAQIGGKGDKGGNAGSGTDIGWNTETFGLGVKGLAAIGGLYNAYQSHKLAKEQFNFTKEVTNTNLNNQIKTFNTTMEDRARARARLDGREDTEGYTQDYMNKNRISRG